MIGVFNTITLNETEILRPNNFELKKEDVYKSEYTTCTGKTIADRIGWKYSDATLAWDILPEAQLLILSGLSGEATLAFEDSDGQHTETIIRKGFANTPKRTTGPDGNALWSEIEMEITFINVHND